MVLKIGFSFAVLAGLCFTSRLVCVQCMLYLVLFIDYERMEFIVLNDKQSWAMATCYLMYNVHISKNIFLQNQSKSFK